MPRSGCGWRAARGTRSFFVLNSTGSILGALQMLVESAPTGEKVTTPSGLQYQDVAVGSGPSPLTGFQVRRRGARWRGLLRCRGSLGCLQVHLCMGVQLHGYVCAASHLLQLQFGPKSISMFFVHPELWQVVVNYVAMTPEGRVFDSSLDKGQAYQFRYGVGDVIPGAPRNPVQPGCSSSGCPCSETPSCPEESAQGGAWSRATRCVVGVGC